MKRPLEVRRYRRHVLTDRGRLGTGSFAVAAPHVVRARTNKNQVLVIKISECVAPPGGAAAVLRSDER